jgi:hypothetical protein
MAGMVFLKKRGYTPRGQACDGTTAGMVVMPGEAEAENACASDL